jgi:lipid II:glycine glycyltransferase (peptidoglycan interpeptide bridge formation enzyme)
LPPEALAKIPEILIGTVAIPILSEFHKIAPKASQLMDNLGYKIEVDNVTESDWSRLMDRFEDANIYQTWSYGAVRWGARNLSHIVVNRDMEVVGMAQLRIIRPAGFRVGIAYLRWGPMCQVTGQELSCDILQAVATALWQEYVERRGLYLEILPNAFAGSVRAKMFQCAFNRFTWTAGISAEKYRTLLLDLTGPLEELRKKLDKKWRNQLNAADRNNLDVLEGTSVDEYRKFCELYNQMRRRKRFETSVSIEEFGRIQELLPPNQRMRVFICLHENHPVAGLVCSAMGDSAIYLLGATNEDGMRLKAAYTLQWAVLRHLKGKGIRFYDLGGIDPTNNPGVYHFKHGLSGTDVSHMGCLIACDSSFSAAYAGAGQVIYRNLRRLQRSLVKGMTRLGR